MAVFKRDLKFGERRAFSKSSARRRSSGLISEAGVK